MASQESETKVPVNERIPNLKDFNKETDLKDNSHISHVNINSYKTPYYIIHRKVYKDNMYRIRKEYKFVNFCILSVCISFVLGLLIGIVLMSKTNYINQNPNQNIDINDTLFNTDTRNTRGVKTIDKNRSKYAAVTFTGNDKLKKDVYPKGLTENMKAILKDNIEVNRLEVELNKTNFDVNAKTVLYDNVFWGPEIENAIPQGYGYNSAEIWEDFVNQSEIVKMEAGCGRMQNRLVTFSDGIQACVRYRQNTDQIQGEIFSFYVAKLLNLTNLAPSVVKIVDLKDNLWKNVASDIATAQWNSNRAVVLTQFIPSLESAKIPNVFRPSNRHLNKHDVLTMCLKEHDRNEPKDLLLKKIKTKKLNTEKVAENFDHIDMKLNKKTVEMFVELAQWSDLIIFDYLTANLDRIVNNLFNFQWNVNIMDGPAHNLARKMDSGLLIFLDNESGLLHGYRLLKKYNIYHSLMLDNLCVFRKSTIHALKKLHIQQNVGTKLSDMFHDKNNAVIRDILPSLPEKNAKILHERIGRVLSQFEQCEQKYSTR